MKIRNVVLQASLDDKLAKINTQFMTKMADKNHTLWCHTYLYSPYKGVLPPSGSKDELLLKFWLTKQFLNWYKYKFQCFETQE